MGVKYSKKRVVAFIVTKSGVGGAQDWVKREVEKVQATDLDVLVIAGEMGCMFRDLDVESVILPELMCRTKVLLVIGKLRRILKTRGVDLLVASSADAGVVARFACFLTRVRVVYVSHGWSCLYQKSRAKWFFVLLESLLSTITDLVVCVSSSDMNKAVKYIKIKRSKLLKIFPKLPDTSARNHGLGNRDKRLNFLVVSRHEHPKRTDIVIEAFKKLDHNLYIYGEGFLVNDFLNGTTFCPSNIFFKGEVVGFDDYSSYDVFLLASDSEGLPISGIKALRVGMPVILSDVGGCNELFSGNGYLLTHNSEEEIIRAVDDVSRNFTQYSRRSRMLFEEKFLCDGISIFDSVKRDLNL